VGLKDEDGVGENFLFLLCPKEAARKKEEAVKRWKNEVDKTQRGTQLVW